MCFSFLEVNDDDMRTLGIIENIFSYFTVKLLATSSISTMGPKRGRLLIRQPRIKRDSDNAPTGGSTHSPDAEFEAQPPFSQRLLTVPHHSSSVHTQHLHQPQLLHQTHPHHHHHAKMERHASEPAPSNMSTITSAHLLSVPSQTPFLVKQHSHPLLLPSQSSLDNAGGGSTAHYLYRQLSYPTTSDSGMSLLIPMSSAATSSIISSVASTSSIVTTPTCCSPTTSSMAQFIDRPVKNEDQPDCVPKLRAISPSIVVMTDTTPPIAAESMPIIRVKSEELQRSLSTPQVSVPLLYTPQRF